MIRTGRHFQSECSSDIQHQTLKFQTMTDELLFGEEENAPDASAWTFAYVVSQSDPDSGRPVMFAYNGGPGSCSLPLHSMLLAPFRADCGDGVHADPEGPFLTRENTDCLLDICDIVCIDPIGCGYGRFLREDHAPLYKGTENDSRAMSELILYWLKEHGRLNSPVYLCGESYGTTRSGLMADYLSAGFNGAAPVHVAGCILIGTALDHGQEQYHIFRGVLTFPTLAATWRYHHPDKVSASLEDWVNESMDFAWNDYARARLFGSSLSEEEQTRIAERIRYYTGTDMETLKKRDLDIDSFSYKAWLYQTEHRIVSNYDTRFCFENVPEDKKDETMWRSKDSETCYPAMRSALENKLKPALGLDVSDEYDTMTREDMKGWEFRTKLNSLNHLENAMKNCPDMRVFFVAGIYDLLTTWGYVRYVQTHNHYPRDRSFAKYYASGHMVYLSDQEASELLQDMRKWMLQK